MTATIVAVTQSSNVPPRVELTVAGVTGATANIRRTDATGAVSLVRGAAPVALVGGGAALFDYEIPFGTGTSTYSVLDATGTVVATATASMFVGQSWLIHPAVPALSQPVKSLLTEHVETSTSGVTLQYVPGRADPIPIGAGTRNTSASSVTFYTEAADEEQGLTALLSGTIPLLAQLWDPTSNVTLYQWWSIGDVSKTTAGAAFGDPWREWSVPYTVVTAPAATVQAQWTWADVIANYPTWQDVMNAFVTWQGLLTGIEGT